MTNLHALAQQALQHLLAGTPMTITHVRPVGFPLPVKRMPDNPDGTVMQSYRPIAVLEYVDDKIKAPPAPVQIAPPAIKLVAPPLPLPPLRKV